MIVGVLLAAGGSRRFGDNKLIQGMVDGTTLIRAAATNLLPHVDRLVIVVRPQDKDLPARLQGLDVDTVSCADSELGMGHSIACGVARYPQADGWIIALADMPYIQAETLDTLVKLMHTGVGIAAPVFQGQRGHPVGFQQRYFDALVQLTGDRGAKSVIEADMKRFRGFACQDPGVVRDIDYPRDLVLH